MSNEGITHMRFGNDGVFNRPLLLLDTTNPGEPPAAGHSHEDPNNPSRRDIIGGPTRSLVKRSLAKGKYTSRREDRVSTDLGVNACIGSTSDVGKSTTPPSKSGSSNQDISGLKDSCSVLDQSFSVCAQKQQKGAERASPRTSLEYTSYEVDVLYENQRGWFFFGIPLYSQSSLLQFDPSPWMTKDGKDSAVNITNAQAPNPSWQWAWKSWYVDMSHDVDEEGWQYSLSFSRRFSWHGTHPWFHSFVRRRRWIRKRVQGGCSIADHCPNMHELQELNSDYFTIHSNRGRRPASALKDTTTRGSSPESRTAVEQCDMRSEEIKDMPSLMKALRLAVIDRGKIDAVKRFVETGADEVVGLEKVIPEIMGFLVFQSSRMQILNYLRGSAEGKMEGCPTLGVTEESKTHLREAVAVAANYQVGGLGYRNDRTYAPTTIDKARFEHSKEVAVSQIGTTDPVERRNGVAAETEMGFDHIASIPSVPPGSEQEAGNSGAAGKEVEQNERIDSIGKDTQREEKPTSLPTALPPDSVMVND